MRLLFFTLLLFAVGHHTATAQQPLTEEEQKLLEKNLDGAFRGFIWDIPKTVILEEETATFLGAQNTEEGDILFYLDYIEGLRCTIGYEFKDNKLWRIKVFNETEYPDRMRMVHDLAKIQQSISKRFGKPIKEDLLWNNKAEQAYPDSWGWAVYRGELFFNTVWQRKDTKVTAFLGAKEEYNPEMKVTYQKIESVPQPSFDDEEDNFLSLDP